MCLRIMNLREHSDNLCFKLYKIPQMRGGNSEECALLDIHQDHYKVVFFCIRFNILWNSRWLTHSSFTFPSCKLLAVGTKDQAIAATSRQLHNKSPAPAPS